MLKRQSFLLKNDKIKFHMSETYLCTKIILFLENDVELIEITSDYREKMFSTT